jgi:2-keto-3-deoxy-6-phosphogluconate aldolase
MPINRGVLNERLRPPAGLETMDIPPCISEKMIVSIGGSWIARKEDIENRGWDVITQRAREAVNLVKKAGGRI